MWQSPFVKCCDCSFIAASQGHLGVHRSKMHRNDFDANIKSVNIIRLFPERKSHYCCLCNNIIGSFPNFKCYFATTHKDIDLKVSAKCLICDGKFAKSSGAGVHLKSAHQIGKDGPYPVSPSPVMSYIDVELNNSTLNSTRCRRSRRSTLLIHHCLALPPAPRQMEITRLTCNMSIPPSPVHQPQFPLQEPRHLYYLT